MLPYLTLLLKTHWFVILITYDKAGSSGQRSTFVNSGKTDASHVTITIDQKLFVFDDNTAGLNQQQLTHVLSVAAAIAPMIQNSQASANQTMPSVNQQPVINQQSAGHLLDSLFRAGCTNLT